MFAIPASSDKRVERGSRRHAARDWSWPCVWVLCFFTIPPVVSRAQQLSTPLVVWDFDHSLTNVFGGQYNAYAREPSRARTYLDPDVPPSPNMKPWSRHSLRITAHREAAGFCGVWFDFYPAATRPARSLDVSRYKFLSFWVKGQSGSEDFDVSLADDTRLKYEDAKVARPLHAYLPSGASKAWEEVLIPLADFRGLDLTHLVRMTVDLTVPGDYRFYLAEIAFKEARTDVPAPPENLKSEPIGPASPYAIWVWNSEDLLNPAHPDRTARFLDFCAQRGIREVYLSLDLDSNPKSSEPHFELRNPEGYRKFLEVAHAKGLRIEGLAGSPEWAARENHPTALAALESVLEFNRASAAGARFDGLHLDVEPYLLPGYADPQYRPQLLEDFIQLIAECVERAGSASQFSIGCDVPAWFYPAGGVNDPSLDVVYHGIEKPVGEQLTDLLDSVTIMDYRNEADGAGGIIASGLPALQHAAKAHSKIVVGLETSRDPDSIVYFVCGLTQEEFRNRLAASGLRDRLYYEDWRISTISDGANVYVGLTAPFDLAGTRRSAFDAALLRLAQLLGGSSANGRLASGPLLDEAQAAVARDPEWREFAPFKLPEPPGHGVITGFTAVHHMLEKTTFYGLGRNTFNEETQSTVEWLSPEPSFQGLAIHYYEPYRDLMEGK